MTSLMRKTMTTHRFVEQKIENVKEIEKINNEKLQKALSLMKEVRALKPRKDSWYAQEFKNEKNLAGIHMRLPGSTMRVLNDRGVTIVIELLEDMKSMLTSDFFNMSRGDPYKEGTD